MRLVGSNDPPFLSILGGPGTGRDRLLRLVDLQATVHQGHQMRAARYLGLQLRGPIRKMFPMLG